MLDQQDIRQLSELFEAQLKPIKEDISQLKEDVSQMKEDINHLKEDVEQLKEDTEITRDVTNSIGEWIDFYFKEDRPYPIPEESRKIS